MNDGKSTLPDLRQPIIDRRNLEQAGDRLVIKTDDGEIVWHFQPAQACGEDEAGGNLVAGNEQGVRTLLHREQPVHQGGAVFPIDAAVQHPVLPGLTAQGRERVGIGLQAAAAARAVAAADRKRDAAPPLLPQIADRGLKAGVMIDIHRGEVAAAHTLA
ncbi:hypothetical protein D3C74_372720 [compost metagenome]